MLMETVYLVGSIALIRMHLALVMGMTLKKMNMNNLFRLRQLQGCGFLAQSYVVVTVVVLMSSSY